MAASKIENAPWVRLGDYIESTDVRNTDNKLTEKDVRGISTEKSFIETKANLDGVSLTFYKVVKPKEFVYVADTSRRGEKIALALNSSNVSYLISSIYTTFKIKDTKKLLSEYLFLLLSRSEFDRYSRFNSWGSARETFDWSEMCRVKIPLPSIETQRELAAVYNGLKELAEENEKLLEPLSKSCQAFIVDCKKKYPSKRLGDYIEESDERNSAGKYTLDDVRGISNLKELIETKANLDGVSLTSYKVVNPREFVYVADTSRRGEKIALALNSSNVSYLISSIYTTFKTKDTKKLLSEYLFLLLSRSEFDRYSRFNSWGSAREIFDWSEMCRVQIPLPPIEIQQKIVDLYNCYEECKRIANQAREKIKSLCQALVQKAAHSG